MKIISVIGNSKSGKTTLILTILEILKRYDINVGSVKSIIHRENFSFDRLNSNTYLHRKAGASPVCAMTQEETVFFFEPLEINEIIKIFKLLRREFLIIEGLKEHDFPAIICAKSSKDAFELSKGKNVLFYSGIFANVSQDLFNERPVYHYKKDRDKIEKFLLNYLNTK